MQSERKYLHVRVLTNRKKETLEQKNGTYYISVKEKAERGQANKRIKELLANELECIPNQFRLIKGAHSPSKTYTINK